MQLDRVAIPAPRVVLTLICSVSNDTAVFQMVSRVTYVGRVDHANQA
jgi:hypothetical protein